MWSSYASRGTESRLATSIGEYSSLSSSSWTVLRTASRTACVKHSGTTCPVNGRQRSQVFPRESSCPTRCQTFALPIRPLKSWFTEQKTKGKREEIAALIRSLAQRLNPETEFFFPDIGYKVDKP